MKKFTITSYLFNVDFHFRILKKNENISEVVKIELEEELNNIGETYGYTQLNENGVYIYLSNKAQLPTYVHEIIHAVDFTLYAKGLFGEDNKSNSEVRAYTVAWLLNTFKQKI